MIKKKTQTHTNVYLLLKQALFNHIEAVSSTLTYIMIT